MLTCVDISNYRGFKTYRMEGLARVNLLVGKNNSGKTALLEGLQFLASGGEPGPLIDAATRRGEVILRSEEPTARPGTPTLIEIAHFFHGHTLTMDTSFNFAGGNGLPQVSVKVIATKSGRARDDESGGERVGVPLPMLKIEGGRPRERGDDRLYRLTRDGGAELETGLRFRRGYVSRRSEGVPVRFVSTESLDVPILASLWDEVTLSGRELEVRDSLRIIEEQIESVHFLAGMLSYGYVGSRAGAVVGLKGQSGRIPLGSLGDGMRRLLALSTSLVVSPGGLVFVDEIDTGLHYSVMTDMWKLVVETAVKNDAQVFAATHSWDCVSGLGVLCQREPDLMQHLAVHKIDRGLDHSVPFAGDKFVRAVEGGIELR